MRGDERTERGRVEQGHVAREHDDLAGEAVGQGRDAHLDRAAGAGDLVLVDHEGLRRQRAHDLDDLVAIVAHDRDDVARAELLRGREHVADERQAGERVQDLRQAGAHAGALAGGEDHDRDGGAARLAVDVELARHYGDLAGRRRDV